MTAMNDIGTHHPTLLPDGRRCLECNLLPEEHQAYVTVHDQSRDADATGNGWIVDVGNYPAIGLDDTSSRWFAREEDARAFATEVAALLIIPIHEFYNHHGSLTADPRCELGLCRQCIDEDLARADPVSVPSLSPLDPSYLSDPAYEARYQRALAALGVKQRPMDKPIYRAALGDGYGELGIPFTVVGSVAQSLGVAAYERDNVTREAVIGYMTGPDYDEDELWTVVGPLIDEIEDAVRVNAKLDTLGLPNG